MMALFFFIVGSCLPPFNSHAAVACLCCYFITHSPSLTPQPPKRRLSPCVRRNVLPHLGLEFVLILGVLFCCFNVERIIKVQEVLRNNGNLSDFVQWNIDGRHKNIRWIVNLVPRLRLLTAALGPTRARLWSSVSAGISRCRLLRKCLDAIAWWDISPSEAANIKKNRKIEIRKLVIPHNSRIINLY